MGSGIQGLQNLNSGTPRSLSLPEYGPGQLSSALEDCHSLKSVDSGIPTLEIGNPEPVHCSVLNVKRKQSEPEIVPDRAFQSACTLPSYVPPHSLTSEHDHAVRKSSTFPRTGYDTVKLYSPTSKTLNRSDDISVCSVSSLSTELSTTLSVSNEDILDFVVTSSSSAIVNLETDEAHFSDVTLNSTKETKGVFPSSPSMHKKKFGYSLPLLQEDHVPDSSLAHSSPLPKLLGRTLGIRRMAKSILCPHAPLS